MKFKIAGEDYEERRREKKRNTGEGEIRRRQKQQRKEGVALSVVAQADNCFVHREGATSGSHTCEREVSALWPRDNLACTSIY